MSRHSSQISISDGIFAVDGQPTLLVSSEYPYFRDHSSNWKDRLSKLRSIGIDIITCYIPWRHHQPDAVSPPDFSGTTQSNRNVLGFIEICRSLELMLIVKPGPFIHAEVNYGGLPDWACPLQNTNIEPMLNNQMQPECWSGAQLNAGGALEKWPLPAPFGPEFIKLSTNWLSQVSQAVISPYQYPQGPIVCVQLGNEGIYSDAQHALWDFDYSSSALIQYQLFLEKKYQRLSDYNIHHSIKVEEWQSIMPPISWKNHETENDNNVFLDWGEFQVEYMSKVFTLYCNALKLSIPLVMNLNPPVGDDFGIESWLSRVEPEHWKNVHYGFTNWIGDVSADPSAFNRYQLAAKRSPGPNMEENWGFSKIYDPAYADASTSFYQTLAILNAGATGFNIYTGVGTSFEDKSLDCLSSLPYPDAAPITENGEVTYKARFLSWLTNFLARYGKEYLESTPLRSVGWGYYPPDSRVNAWRSSSGNKPDEVSSSKLLDDFQNKARLLNIDYGLINLQHASLDDLIKFQRLIVVGSRLLDRTVKQNLIGYIQAGGKIGSFGGFLDQDDIAENYYCETAEKNKIVIFDSEVFSTWLMEVERPTIHEGQADIWARSHPEKNLHFITVLFPKGESNKVHFSIMLNDRLHDIYVQAAPSGGAIFRLENDRVTDCIIKGVNRYLDAAVAPFITVDNKITGLDEPGDYSLIAGVIRGENSAI